MDLEKIRKKIIYIIPNLSKTQQDDLIELFSEEVNKAISSAEWEANCGAYDQVVFSIKHGK